MGKVLAFVAKKKKERISDFSGIARCMECKYEWEAVIPEELFEENDGWLGCPECGMQRGRMKHHMENSGVHCVCRCGSWAFHITSEGIYCPNCYTWHELEDLWGEQNGD